MSNIEEHIRQAMEEGQFDDLPGKGKPGAEPEYTAGITSARPGKGAVQVRQDMYQFISEMEGARVADVDVSMGRGGWEGGWEPTWVTSFNGNGNAVSLLARTAKKHDQDAILIMRRAKKGDKGASPKTSVSFGANLTHPEIEEIEQELAELQIEVRILSSAP